MNYQKLVVVGNATDDAKRQKSQKGDVTYASFSVAVRAGKDSTVFFPISAFGKLGEAVATYVTKGREVLVEGRIMTAVNGRFSVVADSVTFGRPPGKAS